MTHSIGEYFLYAEKEQIRESELFFVPAQTFSPYMECVSKILNQITIDNRTIEVNPFYKYEKIFTALLNCEDPEKYREIKQYVFNFWIHEIYQVERLEGMTKFRFECSEMLREMQRTEWGHYIKKILESFEGEELERIAENILKLYSGGEYLTIFTSALKQFLPEAYVYVLDQTKVLIYAGKKENYQIKKKIQSLQGIFFPIGSETEIFWDRHFGVFDAGDAMRFDDILMV